MIRLSFFLLSSLVTCLLTGQSMEQKKIYDEFIGYEIQTWNEMIQAEKQLRGDDNIDVKFYHLDLEIAIDSAWIKGNVLCSFTPTTNNLSSLELDLDHSLTVTGISEPCESFFQSDDKIYITLNESFLSGEIINLIVSYEGKPIEAGGYKGLRYEKHNVNEPIIATLSTPYLAHYWYPCKDGPEDKADSVYVDITIAKKEASGLEFIAVSNGILEETTDNGDSKTFKWRHRYPIVTYYVMAAISNYAKIEDAYQIDESKILPLDYYVFNENYDDQLDGVQNIPEVFDFFTSVFGPYPFDMEKYGMTQLGYYGAIENQTNTIINSMSASTGWFIISVHELAHMWFADMITCESWHEGWLNEGFATYSEALWTEHTSGMEAYSLYMNGIDFFEGGTIYLENANDTFNVFRPIIYYKGAWVLHMLRGVVGDTLFFEALKEYATDPSLMYGHATTDQLKTVFETIVGEELDYFFDEWIYDEFYPHYYYNFDQSTNQRLYLTLYQAQEELLGARPVFEMPVQINIEFDDGTDSTVTVWNDQQLQQFEFELQKTVENISIDKNDWILHKDTYNPNLPVGLTEQGSSGLHIPSVMPNPFNETITVNLTGATQLPLTFRLYDVTGKLVLMEKVISTGQLLQSNHLQKGIYIYQISAENKEIISKGKLIKSQ